MSRSKHLQYRSTANAVMDRLARAPSALSGRPGDDRPDDRPAPGHHSSTAPWVTRRIEAGGHVYGFVHGRRSASPPQTYRGRTAR